MVSEDTYKNKKELDRENISNSEFVLSGGIDAFRLPPISDYAKQNLYHAQAFSIFHYNKGSYTLRKDYNSYMIMYTYSGKGYLEYEGKQYFLEEGDGAFIDCRNLQMYRAETKWDVMVFHFDGPMAKDIFNQYINHGTVKFHEKREDRFHRYIEKILSVYDSPSLYRDLRISHSIEGMLIHLLIINSNIQISQKDVPESVQKIMKYMENNYTEDITLEKMEKMTNTSRYHLSKEFKKYTGFSPHDYLITIRLNQAKILLSTTTLPANKISHMVGIHDINNFTYLFKKRIGKTPIQYRNSSDAVI